MNLEFSEKPLKLMRLGQKFVATDFQAYLLGRFSVTQKHKWPEMELYKP